MTQNEMILNHLKSGKPLTALEALHEFQCMRLPSRINELKQAGHDIVSQMICTNTGKWVAKYFMVK